MKKLKVYLSRPLEPAFPLECSTPNEKRTKELYHEIVQEHMAPVKRTILLTVFMLIISAFLWVSYTEQILNSGYYKIVSGVRIIEGSEISIMLVCLIFIGLTLIYVLIKCAIVLYRLKQDDKNDSKSIMEVVENPFLSILPKMGLMETFITVLGFSILTYIIIVPNFCEWNTHYKNTDLALMHESHKCVGEIYQKNSNGDKHYTYFVGKDDSHLTRKTLDGKNADFKVGHKILLRVSDDFPRINLVLKWTPTDEEIEKYKVPVKLIEQ